MATIISCSIPSMIQASTGPGSVRKPDPNRKKPASSVSWWAPLFGWSSDPDYVNAESCSMTRDLDPENIKIAITGSGKDPNRPGHRFSPGCLTEEKAKQLRRKTAEGSTFHDVMYHSAIASRLATDVSGRVEK
ncbi:PREDICTED: uncharacterized protein LOC104818046 [Tarenaya hassleriana]|uniref:uncharacterized protein LOC104818046 n=1 Tax=Tarenaya hassleriana TaxID=28532 RepID=UPI00053C349F|nr:PREDICTED: uncharacterized protein LOC104818046 [Tarenaya hassleriana]